MTVYKRFTKLWWTWLHCDCRIVPIFFFFGRLYKGYSCKEQTPLRPEKVTQTKSMQSKKEKDRTPENKEPSRITLKDRNVRWRLRALINHARKDVKYSQRRYGQLNHRQGSQKQHFPPQQINPSLPCFSIPHFQQVILLLAAIMATNIALASINAAILSNYISANSPSLGESVDLDAGMIFPGGVRSWQTWCKKLMDLPISSTWRCAERKKTHQMASLYAHFNLMMNHC